MREEKQLNGFGCKYSERGDGHRRLLEDGCGFGRDPPPFSLGGSSQASYSITEKHSHVCLFCPSLRATAPSAGLPSAHPPSFPSIFRRRDFLRPVGSHVSAPQTPFTPAACMKHEGRSSQGAPLQVKPASLIKHEATHFSPECVLEAAAVCSLKQQQMVVGFACLLKRTFRTLFQLNLLGQKQRSGVNIIRPFSPVTMIQGFLLKTRSRMTGTSRQGLGLKAFLSSMEKLITQHDSCG